MQPTFHVIFLFYAIFIHTYMHRYIFFSFAIGLVADTHSNKHTRGGEVWRVGTGTHIKCPHSQTTRL